MISFASLTSDTPPKNENCLESEFQTTDFKYLKTIALIFTLVNRLRELFYVYCEN